MLFKYIETNTITYHKQPRQHYLALDKDLMDVFLMITEMFLLLTWFNFYPSMDKLSHTLWSVGRNYLSTPKLQRLHRWSLGMDK